MSDGDCAFCEVRPRLSRDTLCGVCREESDTLARIFGGCEVFTAIEPAIARLEEDGDG